MTEQMLNVITTDKFYDGYMCEYIYIYTYILYHLLEDWTKVFFAFYSCCLLFPLNLLLVGIILSY